MGQTYSLELSSGRRAPSLCNSAQPPYIQHGDHPNIKHTVSIIVNDPARFILDQSSAIAEDYGSQTMSWTVADGSRITALNVTAGDVDTDIAPTSSGRSV